MRCPTCEADVYPHTVITSLCRRHDCSPRYQITPEAASARWCRYARARGKECANQCQAIDPRETFEARMSQLDQMFSHPEIQEVIGS